MTETNDQAVSKANNNRVLLTGASGFVGSNVYMTLTAAGFDVLAVSRDPQRANHEFPGRDFHYMDLQDAASVNAALKGCAYAVYLVHSMKGDKDYEYKEREAAQLFAHAATAAGIKRIVYLGGVEPAGTPSRHLRSRLMTGAILRDGSVPTIELRAAMIIGSGSESFRMVRDLAARLPLMVLPSWSKSRSEPIGIRDVAYAIAKSLQLSDVNESCVYGLPGPEVLSAKDILLRTAKLCGRNPRTIDVPIVTPKLSSYWIRFITRADPHVAEELVEGLRSHIVSPLTTLWSLCPEHSVQGFDDAVTAALAGEQHSLSPRSRRWEQVLRVLGS